VIRRAERELDDRVGLARFTRQALRRPFPDHWSFMLGEVALYSFVVLVLTGTFLTFFYRASDQPVRYDGPYLPLRGQMVSSAFDSVMRLSFEVRAGLVVRQIHHWAAVVFVLAIVAHLLRVFFTGAFRKPREINWLIGLSMLVTGMVAGFTGYSLPDDLLSGTGVRIAYSVVLSVPFVGTWIAFLLFGGESPTPIFLSRLLVFHIMILPALLIGLITVHLALVWRQKHTDFPGPGRHERVVVGSALWPNYAMKSAGLFFVVAATLSLLGGLFQINPIWLYGPFRPFLASSPAQPDVYLGWLEGSLRLSPAWEPHVFGHTIPGPFFPAVLLPGVLFGILAAFPFLEARFTRDHAEHHLLDRPRDVAWRTGVGVAGLTFVIVLTLAGSNDVLAMSLGISVEGVNAALRAGLFVAPIALGALAAALCRSAGGSRPLAAPERIRIRRSPSGGFVSADAPSAAVTNHDDQAQDRADRTEGEDA
jgi:ubiquinol-cytochrome c reductase cytochrome b subunit